MKLNAEKLGGDINDLHFYKTLSLILMAMFIAYIAADFAGMKKKNSAEYKENICQSIAKP